ncbi:MAG: HlyD family efflux transporter periplasmic adaptor subunit [Mucilaginibacter sp.]|uniref:HlyD family secretion protein n=1 Tax=Mucilaginibacter sp. TaxID=1882438 RepID=UPI00319FAEC5
MKKVFIIAFAAIGLASCSSNKNKYDASGTFETTETIISAEQSGQIKQFNIKEGDILKAGQFIGYIDTVQLQLKKEQLESQIKSVESRTQDIATQTNPYSKQLAVAQSNLQTQLIEQKRIENLVKADAATPKQLDDINGAVDAAQKQLNVIKSEQAAQRSLLTIQNNGIAKDVAPLKSQIAQIDDQLAKCRIENKVTGTVLIKYAEENEIATDGKPLYKIADLSTLILRAYVSGNQLSAVKFNQPVKVMINDTNGNYKNYSGKVEWISSAAEFTPKTIQTKDERANLVYAVKIRVKNDGDLKIGMYADVKL